MHACARNGDADNNIYLTKYHGLTLGKDGIDDFISTFEYVRVGSGRRSERTCSGRIPDTSRTHDGVGMERGDLEGVERG